MSRRMSREVYDRSGPTGAFNEFVEGPPAHFMIRTVPLAPQAKSTISIDAIGRTVSETVSIRCGCPHCHEDIEFRYVAAEAPLNFADNLAESNRRDLQRLREGIDRPRRVAEMQTDAMEEWYTA